METDLYLDWAPAALILGLAIYVATLGKDGGETPPPDDDPEPEPDPCADVSCGEGYVCDGGDCVQGPNWHPCIDVTCGPGEVCQDGQCVPTEPEPPDNEPPDVMIVYFNETNPGFLDVEAEGSDPDGQIAEWDWELRLDGQLISVGDGRESRLALGGSGMYELTVIATDDMGATGSDSFPFEYTA